MTDRELLELAAKAAGIDWFDEPAFLAGKGLHMKSGPFWNPLKNDGDALRLVAQLKIGVRHSRWPSGKSYVTSHKVWNTYDSMFYDDGIAHGDDPAEATRRAIVRAAAAIGKAISEKEMKK